jgi:hypothetical protein
MPNRFGPLRLRLLELGQGIDKPHLCELLNHDPITSIKKYHRFAQGTWPHPWSTKRCRWRGVSTSTVVWSDT